MQVHRAEPFWIDSSHSAAEDMQYILWNDKSPCLSKGQEVKWIHITQENICA